MLAVASGCSGRWQDSSNASCGEVLAYSHLHKRVKSSVLRSTPDCLAIVQGLRAAQKQRVPANKH